MPKSVSTVDLSPDSGINPRPAKPRTRRSRVPSELGQGQDGAAGQSHSNALTPTASKSSLTPILIGVGIGAAVAVTGLVVRSRSQPAAKPAPRLQSTIVSALGKAALLAVGRIVAQRAAKALAQQAIGMLANRAARKVATAWID